MSTRSPIDRDEAPPAEEEAPSDITVFRRAIRRALRFIYRESLWLVGLSVVWFLASVPIVTIGPATVGAYAVILSLRDEDSAGVDRDHVVDVLWKQFVPGVLLGLLPLFFGFISAFYLTRPDRGIVVYALGILAGYITIYLILVLMPTFVELAQGEDVIDALRTGAAWVSRHPGLALSLGTISLFVFVVSLGLTIAFPLLFAGIAFSIQTEVVTSTGDMTAGVK